MITPSSCCRPALRRRRSSGSATAPSTFSGIPNLKSIAPVIIRANAFAEGVPVRDLVLSPDHALWIDGKRIQVRQLINGSTVVQDIGRDLVHYFHVELSSHAILLAENLLAESYLDTGNCAAFIGGGGVVQMHPDFGLGALQAARACAPLATDEATVRPIWQRLAARAAVLGRPAALPEVAAEPDLHLLLGRRRVRPVQADGGHYIFEVPDDVGALRLVSHAARPTDTQPWLDDRRRLGVAVRSTVKYGLTMKTAMMADDEALSDGWHGVEHTGSVCRRWTDGNAAIPVPPGPGILVVDVCATAAYPIAKLNSRSRPSRNARPPRGNSARIAGLRTSSPPV